MLDTNHSPTRSIADIDWDDVLETLQAQRCVLFLGSGACEGPDGQLIDLALSDWLDAKNPNHPHIKLYNSDGFFLFKKNRYKRKVIGEMKRFYNQSFPNTEAQFGRIVRLPFSMIITLTPDNLLARTFDAMGFNYQPDFYFRNRKATEHFESPTQEKPLIYNLLGNIEEPESLVLTHSDFFDYLESVFKARSMPEELKDELEKMERYIFLGLPYEKWYFQLLLRVLSLHSDKLKEIERLALKEFENPNLHKIYTEEFKIDFFPASTSEFIEELYKRCKQIDILKPLPASYQEENNTPIASVTEIREMIAEAHTTEAMLHLRSFLRQYMPKSRDLVNDLLVLRNRYHLLEEREMRGTIDSRDLLVENNQVVELLLNIIDEAENL